MMTEFNGMKFDCDGLYHCDANCVLARVIPTTAVIFSKRYCAVSRAGCRLVPVPDDCRWAVGHSRQSQQYSTTVLYDLSKMFDIDDGRTFRLLGS